MPVFEIIDEIPGQAIPPSHPEVGEGNSTPRVTTFPHTGTGEGDAAAVEAFPRTYYCEFCKEYYIEEFHFGDREGGES